jgi:hypothetical protein
MNRPNKLWVQWFWPWLAVVEMAIIFTAAVYGGQVAAVGWGELGCIILALAGMLFFVEFPRPSKDTLLVGLMVGFFYYDIHAFNLVFAPWGADGLSTSAAEEILRAFDQQNFQTVIYLPFEQQWFSLILAWYLKLCFTLAGASVYVLNNALLALGFFTVLFSALLIQQWFKRKTLTMIAAFFLIFFVPHYFYKMVLSSVTITAPLMMAAVYYLEKTYAERRYFYAALAGIFSALTVMSSFNGRCLIYMLIFGILFPLLFKSGRQRWRAVCQDRHCLGLIGYGVGAGLVTFLPHLGFILAHPSQYFFRWGEGLSNWWAVLWTNEHGAWPWLQHLGGNWWRYLVSWAARPGRELERSAFFCGWWIPLYGLGLYEILRRQRGMILGWAFLPVVLGIVWGCKTENIFFALPAVMLLAAVGAVVLSQGIYQEGMHGHWPWRWGSKFLVAALALYGIGSSAVQMYSLALGRQGKFVWHPDKVMQSQMIWSVAQNGLFDKMILGDFTRRPIVDLSVMTEIGVCGDNVAINRVFNRVFLRYDDMIDFCPAKMRKTQQDLVASNIAWLKKLMAQKKNKNDLLLVWEAMPLVDGYFNFLNKQVPIGTRETKTWRIAGGPSASVHIWRVPDKQKEVFSLVFISAAERYLREKINPPKKAKRPKAPSPKAPQKLAVP